MCKIKILFCIDCLRENQDGVSNTYHRMLERIPSNIEPIVITPLPPEETVFNFPVYNCPSIPFPFYKKYRLAIPQLSKKISKLFNEFQPDVIHWSSPSPLGSMAVRYGRKRRIPVSTIYHTHFNCLLRIISLVSLSVLH